VGTYSTMLISLVSSSQLYLKTPSSTDITITDVLRDTTDKKLDKKLKCVPDALQ